MDAVKLLQEFDRMCHTIICNKCELFDKDSPNNCLWQATSYEDKEEKIVAVIEKWSAEHPVRTRLMDFLEIYPNALLKPDGYPQVLPIVLGYCNRNFCVDCHHINEACWDLPMEEES